MSILAVSQTAIGGVPLVTIFPIPVRDQRCGQEKCANPSDIG
jgi:hypothetical protein